MVGPALLTGGNIPAAGGFNSALETRVMPNNVSDYKANQLEGRVSGGYFNLGGNEPTAYPNPGGELNNNMPTGVSKNRPDTFYSQARYPTMTTKASPEVQGDEIRANWDLSKRPNNASREQINYGFGSIVYRDTVPPN